MTSQPRLVFHYDDGGEEVYPLIEEWVGIGREGDNPIVIDHGQISPHHARLTRDADGGYRIQDLSSQDGTFVNGFPVQEARLSDGDLLRFGSYEVGYRVVDGHAPDQQVEVLKARIAELEMERQQLESQLHPTVNPVALTTGDSGGSLPDEVARLEARQRHYQSEIAQLEERLAILRDVEVPAEEHQVRAFHGEREVLQEELRQLRLQIEQAHEEVQRYENMGGSLDQMQSTIQATEAEQTAKKLLLESTEAALKEATENRDAAVARETEAEDRARLAQDQVEQAQKEAKRLTEEIAERERQRSIADETLAELHRRMADEEETRKRYEASHEEQRILLDHTVERLRLLEEKEAGRIQDWSAFERSELQRIADRKIELDEQYVASEARLKRIREDLQTMRDQIRREQEAAELTLRELREDHYEPVRSEHDELLQKNQHLEKQVLHHQEQLEKLVASIRDGQETERLVASSLQERGQTLETLEARIGKEVNQIRAEVIRLQQPVKGAAGPPSLPPDLGPLFQTRSTPPPVPSGQGNDGGVRVSMVIYVPDHTARSADYRAQSQLPIDEPLPLGFEGLAAATRGAVFSSMAMTVESGLPVLFAASEDLAHTADRLRKLRGAMPLRTILLGWSRETFDRVTESMHEGAQFQELLGILAQTSGSITQDPYMNTFFESLNQGQRFLYLPPVFPWNPRAKASFRERQGLVVDLDHFEPESLLHRQALTDLQQLVVGTEIPFTLIASSEAQARKFHEMMPMSPQQFRSIPRGVHERWHEELGRHLALISFEPVSFTSTLLRDSLFMGTPLISPQSEAYHAFFAELHTYQQGQTLPMAATLQRMMTESEVFDRVVKGAERKLVSEYSYQSAARQLEGFLGTLPA